MWVCDKCQEEHEDQFTSCWNCDSVEKGNPAEDLLARFACMKCGGTDSIAREHRLDHTALAVGKKSRYLAITCQACAFTEFYDLEIL